MYDPLPPIQEADQETNDNNAAVFVALYVVLLAFFIMLNGMAKVEPERVKHVIKSLSSTFAIDEPQFFQPGLDRPRPLGQALTLIGYYQQLGKVMSAPLELSETVVKPLGDHMEVSLPLASVFIDNSDKLRIDRNPWLAELAALLTHPQPGTQLHLAIIVGGDNALALPRVAFLAHALALQGVPVATISAGSDPDADAQMVTLRFIVVFSGKGE